MGNKKNKRVVMGTLSGGKSTVGAVTPNTVKLVLKCTMSGGKPIVSAVAPTSGSVAFGDAEGSMPQPKSGGLTIEDIMRLRAARLKREAQQ